MDLDETTIFEDFKAAGYRYCGIWQMAQRDATALSSERPGDR